MWANVFKPNDELSNASIPLESPDHNRIQNDPVANRELRLHFCGFCGKRFSSVKIRKQEWVFFTIQRFSNLNADNDRGTNRRYGDNVSQNVPAEIQSVRW